MRFLRMSVRWGRSGHHPTASSAKLANDSTDRPDDCGCQQSLSNSLQSECDQTFEIKGNLLQFNSFVPPLIPQISLVFIQEAGSVMDVRAWPPTLDTDDMPKKKLANFYRAPTAEMLAYLDFSVSTTGMLAGIKMSHAATTALCRSMKQACELYPSRHVALCLDPYCGLGFALWCLSRFVLLTCWLKFNLNN